MGKAPKFQHRHYAPIAELLYRHSVSYQRINHDAALAAVASMANELETMFAMDNEHFDRERWRDAVSGAPSKKDKRTAAKALPNAAV